MALDVTLASTDGAAPPADLAARARADGVRFRDGRTVVTQHAAVEPAA